MTTTRRRTAAARPAPDGATTREPAGTITAVAGGSLGTAANLEDTQEYTFEELQAATPTREAAPALVAVAPEPAVPKPIAPVSRPEPAPAARVVPVPAFPMTPVGTRRARPLAGGAIAAIVLVAVIGGAALLALAGGVPRFGAAPGTDAAGTPAPATAPATNPPGGGNGNHGGGNGNGHGHGH